MAQTPSVANNRENLTIHLPSRSQWLINLLTEMNFHLVNTIKKYPNLSTVWFWSCPAIMNNDIVKIVSKHQDRKNTQRKTGSTRQDWAWMSVWPHSQPTAQLAARHTETRTRNTRSTEHTDPEPSTRQLNHEGVCISSSIILA